MSLPVPPGLDYLLYVDQLIVQQQVDMTAMFIGWETSNRYLVNNIRGETVYYAVEQTDLLTRNYFGAGRPFDLLVMDNMRSVVLKMRRPFQLQGLACCGFVQEVEVTSGTGQLLGTVRQRYAFCGKRFEVLNSAGQTIFRIEGPACTFGWIDTDFRIHSAVNNQCIGVITRKFPGIAQQMLTHADVFGIRFPMDLQVAMKAVLLGATFLIDFMYFERTARTPLRDRMMHQQQQQQRPFQRTQGDDCSDQSGTISFNSNSFKRGAMFREPKWHKDKSSSSSSSASSFGFEEVIRPRKLKHFI